MGKAGVITNEMRDHIDLLFSTGISVTQIGRILGISDTASSNVISIIKSAKEKNTDKLRAMYYKGNQTTVLWACGKYGVSTDKILNREEPKEEPKPEPKPEPTQNTETRTDNTAQAFMALLDAVKELKASINAIDKRLSAMQLTQQGFRGDVGDKIGKVVEAININGDILTKEHDKMTDLLGGIKQNTKKRPWQEGQT